jgi:hypothetical protein
MGINMILQENLDLNDSLDSLFDEIKDLIKKSEYNTEIGILNKMLELVAHQKLMLADIGFDLN